LPVLLTAIKELNVPRYPSVRGIFEAYAPDAPEIPVWSINDLVIDSTQIGLKGSPTNVYKSFVPTKSKTAEIIDGINGKEKAAILVNKLADLKLI